MSARLRTARLPLRRDPKRAMVFVKLGKRVSKGQRPGTEDYLVRLITEPEATRSLSSAMVA